MSKYLIVQNWSLSKCLNWVCLLSKQTAFQSVSLVLCLQMNNRETPRERIHLGFHHLILFYLNTSTNFWAPNGFSNSENKIAQSMGCSSLSLTITISTLKKEEIRPHLKSLIDSFFLWQRTQAVPSFISMTSPRFHGFTVILVINETQTLSVLILTPEADHAIPLSGNLDCFLTSEFRAFD